MKQKVLLVIAVAFGLLAFFLTYRQIEEEKKKAYGGFTKMNVLFLKNDLIAGLELTRDDLEIRQVDVAKRTAHELIKASLVDRIIGQKLIVSLPKSYRLKWSDLAQAGRQKKGVTKLINRGFRAISISVDNISSVTNLIQPGDRVDIIGTFRFPEMKGDMSLDTLTLTILQYVKIIATGTNYGLKEGKEKSRRNGNYNTVTLELTPKEAEMIIFASQKGRLTLTLRNQIESAIETDLQSVNFKFLQEKIGAYNKDRAAKKLNYGK